MAKRNHKMPYYGPQNVPGQIARGNVDLANRPKVRNADGSVSTVMSFSVGADDGAVLLPQVLPNGTMPSIEEALKFGKKSRQNLGFFDSNDSADAYAEALHNEQAKQYPSEQNAGSFYSPKNVGRPGSLGLLEALKMAQDRYAAEQAGKPPAAPFNLQQTLQGADKAIQQGVFGAVDAIGSEGKRLIDGKFGFDALSQALPQLAQSGPQNLAEALATTRQGGAQWTNQDLQAQRDRDNLGMAAGGALDASLLVPGLGVVPKGAYKAAGKTIAGAVDNMMPAEIARDVERVYSVPTKFGDVELNVFPRGKSAEVTWDWAGGVPREAIDAAPVSAGREAMRAVKGSLARDAKATKQPAYTFSGTSDAHTRLYNSMLDDPNLPFKPMKDAGSDTLGMQRKMLGGPVEVPDWAKGLKPQIDDGAAPDFMGDPELWRKYDSRAVDRPPEATTLGMGFPFSGKDGEKPLLSALMDAMRGKGANDRKLTDVISNLGENPDAANFGATNAAKGLNTFGERPKIGPITAPAVNDAPPWLGNPNMYNPNTAGGPTAFEAALQAQQTPKPSLEVLQGGRNPLDQFTPPTTLDDIFTGGAPRGPRELSGGTEYPAGLDSSFMNDPRFNGAGVQDPVPYDPAKGFGGLDARFASDKNAKTLSEALAKARKGEPIDPDTLALLLSYGAASGMGSALWAQQAHQQQPGM